MSVVVLLPARNAAHDLPGWFATVAPLADAVVALDDGSTDTTRDLLAAHPLVHRLLTNPVRDTYAGWDDAANRNRLLDAAADLAPTWIVSLDADERLDPDDARALRTFLDHDALPGLAYGLQLYRAVDDDHVVGPPSYVYRVFGWRPGQRFPDERLHLEPIPTSIPAAARVRTTIRVRHVGTATEPERSARLAKYREADPEGRYPTDFGGLDRPPTGARVPWSPRPPGLDVLATPPVSAVDEDGSPRVVVLLPARNAAHDLPGWFDSVAPLADAVVALDDGSTDTTRDLLAAHPLVHRLLTNPVRDTYAGWDDAANRNRLLDAAADLAPTWIVSLDADERLDPDDARALRTFLDHDALPGLAYGFRVFRMRADEVSYDRAGLWVYRAFAWAPGQRFPEQRLHLVPIPTSIPRHRWVRTTIRIQHLASTTEQRRRARYAKYLEADPDREHQDDYAALLTVDDGTVHPWQPRPTGSPVVAVGDHQAGAGDVTLLDDEVDPDAPLLSAIVISRDDEDRIERSVRSVVSQVCPAPFEVIVVTSGRDRTAEIVRERFPEVTLIELDGPALPGRARNAGLRVARGEYVSFPGSHVELPPGSLAARLAAHELGYPMVTGTTLNGTDTPSGWASYFLDHASVLPGRPSEELTGPPAHCSYTREFLGHVGGFPEDRRAGEDTVVNTALWQLGFTAYRARDVRLIHASRCTNVVRLVRHHFVRGRAMGRLLAERDRSGSRLPDRATLAVLARYPRERLRRTAVNVHRWGGPLEVVHRRVRPLIVAGTLAAWAGTAYELARRTVGARAAEPTTDVVATVR